MVGLSSKMNSFPDELSGGEQQRVSIARAVVNHPPLLVCDEPTGNLDPDTSVGIMQLLYRINRAGTTILMVTHDREMVDKMRKRVIALEDGKLARDERRGGYTIRMSRSSSSPLGESWQSIRQNLSTTVAATMTVLIGMCLLGLFIALGTWVLSWSDHLQDQLRVKVNFCTTVSMPECSKDATQAQIQAVGDALRDDSDVEHVVFVSKEEESRTVQEGQPGPSSPARTACSPRIHCRTPGS